jgi:PKD repeat protein
MRNIHQYSDFHLQMNQSSLFLKKSSIMKKLLSLLIILVTGFSGWSQPGDPNNLVIYGNVKNISTGNPVKNHYVYLDRFTPGPSYSETRLTDSLGNYRFIVPNGSVIGPNVEYRILTYDCDSVPKVLQFSNLQGTLDVKNINFEICEQEGPQCRAIFDISPSILNPLRILFKNFSIGENLSYKWFVNGNLVSVLKEPEVTFPNAGVYTVCLRILSGNGPECLDEKCHTITVGGNTNFCNAAFNILTSPDQGVKKGKPLAPYSNNFTYTWTVNNITIQEYDPILPVNPGYNRICLNVNDGANCNVSSCDTLFVPLDSCRAYFSHQLANNNPSKVVFSNWSQGTNPNTFYYWTFGDGGSSTDQNTEHQYQAAGTYEVCLRIYTSSSCADSICKTVIISDTSDIFCDASFALQHFAIRQFRGKPDAPFSNNFSYIWQVNNDTLMGYNPVLTLLYGLNSICLTVTDGASCSITKCDTLSLPIDSCFANFSFKPSTNAENRMLFTNESVPGIDSNPNYIWIFGDGSSANTKNAEHTYTSPGVYEVCLKLYSNHCADSICKTITVGNNQIPCDADFTFNNFRRAPAQVQFNSKPGQTEANGFTHQWFLGNDSVRHHPNPVFAFPNPGVYTICHKVINNSTNCVDQKCKTITILPADSNSCDARFFIAPSNAIQNRFFFQNNSIWGSDTMNVEVKWIFGDGSAPSFDYHAEHTYANPGTYTVCLFIRSGNCEDQVCKTIVVQGDPNACNADFHWNRLNNENPYKIAFHAVNSSNTGLNHVWRFSNTNQSELPNPVHTFPGPGTYNVCHVVYNPAGSCRDTVCKQIVLPPLPNDTLECHAKFIWFTSEGNPQKVIFKNQSSQGQYSWSFGDSTYSTEINPQHVYSQAGSYQVCLRVQRANCTDIFCTYVNVSPGDTGGFTIGGRVFAGANFADVAKVNLIRRDPVSQALYVFKTTLVDSLGYYSFEGLPSGVYLIRAGLLAPSAYFNFYVPTYFGSQYYWQFAEPVVVNASGDTYNIALIYGNNNGGPGGVGGGITGPIRMDGPVSQATVIVTNLFDGPQRWTVTDENGQFSIGNLAYGTYRLWADYQGMVCVPVEFTISAENPEVEFTLNMGSELITIITEARKSAIGSELYPNPASNLFNLDLYLNNPARLEIQLINLAGQVVLSRNINAGTGLQQMQIPVSDTPAGMYFVNIRDAASRSLIGTRKLTITH